MPDQYQVIYQQHAVEYDRLVKAEDYQGNLLKAITEIARVKGALIAEMGAGTGRVTRLLASEAATVVALDASAHMLGLAAEAVPSATCHLIVADNRCLPLASGFADIAIEGWSYGHLTGWYPDTWRSEMQRTLSEMQRVAKPGGVMILIETLGTGHESPQPPSDSLAEFYKLLEYELGFHSTAIRTDYRFTSREAAQESIDFFFTDMGLEDRLWDGDGGVILPECTGLWWRKVT
jgi:ubiquinone/menaquinone biosynthesis C-methylase UbiE